MKRITIRDIAEKAGVSVSTVSLVLNNKGYVSSETRKKIEQIIEDYDYIPSVHGKNLARRYSNLIGAVISDVHFYPQEKFYTQLFLSMVINAQKMGKNVLLSIEHPENYNTKAENIVLPEFIRDRSVDGVIVIGDIPEVFISELIKRKIPTVLANYYSIKFKDILCITVDNKWGGYLATNHLVSLGHKKICFLGCMMTHPSLRDRLEGYKEALRDNDIEVDDKYIFTSTDISPFEYGYQMGMYFIENKINATAIFAITDLIAMGCIKALKNHGVKIPDDVAIVGYDDINVSAISDPKLTTIRNPKERVGERAIEKIVDMVYNENFAPAYLEHVVLPVELVVRESCGSSNRTDESANIIL